ncbi:MAG: hypothetical protein NC307_13300 [Roseburia sp.]|nr:hypothetical protein [Roseburia sp.]
MTAQEREIDRIINYIRSCQKAKEKQLAQEPIGIEMCTCPRCGTYNEAVGRRRNTVDHDIVYCWHCGQAMKVGREER